MDAIQFRQLQKSLANPAPLGLLGLGITTILLNLNNTRLFSLDSMIIAMGLILGAYAQFIAGLLSWIRGNVFGFTAFIAYSLFWTTLAGLLILLKVNIAGIPEYSELGYYLFGWSIFSIFMFVGALKLHRGYMVVFGSLTLLFILLAIGNWTESIGLISIAGYLGMISGGLACYTGFGIWLNEVYGRTILPLGEAKPSH